MFDSKEKKFREFLEILSKLEPIEYIGLCKILGVDVVNENGEPLDFQVTLGKVMNAFLKMKKKPRNQLMEMLRASQKGGDQDGTCAED